MQLKTLVKFTIVFALCVIVMGVYTRLSDAGLGCPDWPGCYGKITVPSDEHDISLAEQAFPERPVEAKKAWLEMIHRYIAGALGLLVFWILILSLKSDHGPKKLPILLALVVIFQAALGMWTVTMKLMPIVVMGHLLGGFTLLSLLFLLYLRIKPLTIQCRDYRCKQLAPLATFALGVLVIQIVLGGWTSANYAALSCTSLPFCEGDWTQNLQPLTAFSPFQGNHISFEFGVLDYASRMTIHVSHRIGAIVTALALIYLVLRILNVSISATIRSSAKVLMLLLLIQISLGVANIIFHLPLSVAVLHNFVAALLLATTVFINYAIWRKA